jgi:hypothetical protein
MGCGRTGDLDTTIDFPFSDVQMTRKKKEKEEKEVSRVVRRDVESSPILVCSCNLTVAPFPSAEWELAVTCRLPE